MSNLRGNKLSEFTEDDPQFAKSGKTDQIASGSAIVRIIIFGKHDFQKPVTRARLCESGMRPIGSVPCFVFSNGDPRGGYVMLVMTAACSANMIRQSLQPLPGHEIYKDGFVHMEIESPFFPILI